MTKYTQIIIILKNSESHATYNSRIIDYLNDRHTIINDNKYLINLEIASNENINDFVVDGVQSLPAMKIETDESYIYGTNSIIAALAQLERPVVVNKPAPKKYNNEQPQNNSFYDMVLEEMNNEEQEDPDSQSTVHPRSEDFQETPLSPKSIDTKMEKYSKIYEERMKKNESQTRRRAPSKVGNVKSSLANRNINDMISNSKIGYDKQEEMLMRSMIGN